MKNDGSNAIQWFKHSVDAHNDTRFVALLMLENGWSFVGVYWHFYALLCKAHNKVMHSACIMHAYSMHVHSDAFYAYLDAFVRVGLLELVRDEDGDYYTSPDIAKELLIMQEKQKERSILNSKAAKSRWNQRSSTTVDAQRMHDASTNMHDASNVMHSAFRNHAQNATIHNNTIDSSNSLVVGKTTTTTIPTDLVSENEYKDLTSLFERENKLDLLPMFVGQLQFCQRKDAQGRRIKSLVNYAIKFIANQHDKPTQTIADSKTPTADHDSEKPTGSRLVERVRAKNGKNT